MTYDITNGGSAALSPAATSICTATPRSPAARTAWSASSTGRRSTPSRTSTRRSTSGHRKGQKGLYTAAADNGWVGMVEHYFVNAWLPKAGSKREYYTTKRKTAISIAPA